MDSLDARSPSAAGESPWPLGEPPADQGLTRLRCLYILRAIGRAPRHAEQGGVRSTALFYTAYRRDDQQDPIADASRAILTVTWCCPRLALPRRVIMPAIDMRLQISRAMPRSVSDDTERPSSSSSLCPAPTNQSRDLISGTYSAGSDPLTERPCRRMRDAGFSDV